jgi:hypothetical protein
MDLQKQQALIMVMDVLLDQEGCYVIARIMPITSNHASTSLLIHRHHNGLVGTASLLYFKLTIFCQQKSI